MDGADRLTVFLDEAGVAHRLIEMDSPTRTATAAAAALAVPLDAIVKSLVCLVDDEPVLALVAGDQELSLDKLATARGARRASMAPRRLVAELTGYPAGGVAPVAHVRRLPVVGDHGLSDPGEGLVYCGGGTESRMLELTVADLERLASVSWADLAV